MRTAKTSYYLASMSCYMTAVSINSSAYLYTCMESILQLVYKLGSRQECYLNNLGLLLGSFKLLPGKQ